MEKNFWKNRKKFLEKSKNSRKNRKKFVGKIEKIFSEKSKKNSHNIRKKSRKNR